MYRNQYDHDVSVWSPQGRIFQIEYAMEAVKQGSATVGVKSKDFAVLAALKRSSSELSSYQKKIISIDDHIAVSIAGLTSDARMLSDFMRSECLNSRYIYDSPLPVSRLVSSTVDKMQKPTIVYGSRPFGVGLLVAGYDDGGPHVYQLCPSANFFDCKSMSIGARSQSARTYLERNLDKFIESNLSELVCHALRALRECLPSEQELNTKNCSICIVGKDHPLAVHDNDDVAEYLAMIEQEKQSTEKTDEQMEEGATPAEDASQSTEGGTTDDAGQQMDTGH